MNQNMVYPYRSSYIDLTMALVDCQVEGFPLFLHHVFQGGYVVLNYINFDGAERKICCNCVDNLWVQGKSKTLKKVGDRTVYGMD